MPCLTPERQKKRLNELASRIAAVGGSAAVARLEVTYLDSMQEFVNLALRVHGRVDVIINNAGVMPLSKLEALMVNEWNQMSDVNVRGVLHGIAAALPLLLRQRGTVVNTATVGAVTGPGGMSAYAASKHGVQGLTRAAAMENPARGIRVNAFAPGWTETPMVVANSAQNPAFAALAKQAIPAKRGAHPREIAEAVVWLSSPASSYVHGQLLVADGGVTIGGLKP